MQWIPETHWLWSQLLITDWRYSVMLFWILHCRLTFQQCDSLLELQSQNNKENTTIIIIASDNGQPAPAISSSSPTNTATKCTRASSINETVTWVRLDYREQTRGICSKRQDFNAQAPCNQRFSTLATFTTHKTKSRMTDCAGVTHRNRLPMSQQSTRQIDEN